MMIEIGTPDSLALRALISQQLAGGKGGGGEGERLRVCVFASIVALDEI